MIVDATIFAGIPASNPNLFRRVSVAVGDPAAWVQLKDGSEIVLIRDIEMSRAALAKPGARIACPADFAPQGGLSADRATATAQSLTELLQRADCRVVRVDRTLPFLFAWQLQAAGVELLYDEDLGVIDRRRKTEQELQWLAEAQNTTEEAVRFACTTIANASVGRGGVLEMEGMPLTSERVRQMISIYLMERGYSTPSGSIVATAPHSADCHDTGSGALITGVPVIIDIFPRCDASLYYGDCTRTVVHGEPSARVREMHQAVLEAKHGATKLMKPGVHAEVVHEKVIEILTNRGFESSRGTVSDQPTIQHGTGHGIGLEVHEPILLDHGGGPMLENEVFTVEPGLYGRLDGGVRIEDMIVVTNDGPENLNRLHEGLDWRD